MGAVRPSAQRFRASDIGVVRADPCNRTYRFLQETGDRAPLEQQRLSSISSRIGMPSPADLLEVLHSVALTLFVVGTSVLMLTAILGRLRIRRPLLVWRMGALTRVPLGPSLFLLLVALGIAYSRTIGIEVSLPVLIGYPAGGMFWFVATWLTQSTVITDYGLVPNLPCLHRAVAWSQVVDYVFTSRNGRPHFVFVYRERESREHRRLDLPVPKRCLNRFQDILAAKLDHRRSFTGVSTLGEAVMEQNDVPPDRD
jgi:hypothetical protein